MESGVQGQASYIEVTLRPYWLGYMKLCLNKTKQIKSNHHQQNIVLKAFKEISFFSLSQLDQCVLVSLSLNLLFFCSPFLFYFFLSLSMYNHMHLSRYLYICISIYYLSVCLYFWLPFVYCLHWNTNSTRTMTWNMVFKLDAWQCLWDKKCLHWNKSLNKQKGNIQAGERLWIWSSK